MSYCVNCGVELADSEKSCPLCHTPVINPNDKKDKQVKRPYPPYKTVTAQKVSLKSILELVSWIFAIPLLLCIVCNFTIDHAITWSGYVIGSLVLIYVVAVVPFIILSFTKKGAPAICLFFDFLCLICFLLYIENSTNGEWFFGFALPLVGALFIFLIIVIALRSFRKAEPFTLAAIILVFTGIFCIITEILVNINFAVRDYLIWSFYPMITSIILAVILIIIDKNTALKEKLERKFFI
ncbi:MAG: hypothetical protein DBX47_07595 [Clostridiales bacterium]|nr:MAG: hypothetical protein DBX47_07595 [Clostridiales bacterium]